MPKLVGNVRRSQRRINFTIGEFMSKIVIIYDNTLIAKLYETNLTADGHTVQVAYDGMTGLQLVKKSKPDIVLLDLMMPGISGIEIIRVLRADPEFADLPLLAYSGGDDEVLASARKVGATRVISKKESSLRKILAQLYDLLSIAKQWETVPKTYSKSENLNTAQMETSSLAKKLVLIVEDDLIIVRVIKDIIEKVGYFAVVAGDGREAYQLLAKHTNFAVGIFDVHVPYIEEPDLLRYMRTEKRLMKILVMIMTTDEAVKIQLDSLSAGAAVFLQKPFKRETFETMFMGLVDK